MRPRVLRGISAAFTALSPCRGQVAYALRTRAPVAGGVLLHPYCYTPLPLDLHVLGLPLAFILSQDQTLHCKNCFYNLFDSSVSFVPTDVGTHLTHAISCFKIIQSSLAFINTCCFLKSECKDTTIFQTTKIFFHFFRPKQGKQLWINSNFFSFFCSYPHSIPCKTTISNIKFQVFDTTIPKHIVDNAVYIWFIDINIKNHNIYNPIIINLFTIH